MKQAFLLHHLAAVERHIREGDEYLLRQRKIVAELERHGRRHTQTANIAKDILTSFEMTQSKNLNERVHLLQDLAERK